MCPAIFIHLLSRFLVVSLAKCMLVLQILELNFIGKRSASTENLANILYLLFIEIQSLLCNTLLPTQQIKKRLLTGA